LVIWKSAKYISVRETTYNIYDGGTGFFFGQRKSKCDKTHVNVEEMVGSATVNAIPVTKSINQA
jgi:hypothetical protein